MTLFTSSIDISKKSAITSADTPFTYFFSIISLFLSSKFNPISILILHDKGNDSIRIDPLMEFGHRILSDQSRYFSGFTCAPLIMISKCRCGPVLRPVLPLRAIFSFWSTFCPVDTSILLRCAYLVCLPSG